MTRRIQEVNNLIIEELAQIVNREIELPPDILLTLTRVDTSQDIRYANVFVSVMGGETERVIAILEKNIYHIQQRLNKRLRMRPVPKIRFLIDEDELRREVVEKSIADLQQKGEL